MTPASRARFIQLAMEQLGKPVLWAQRGPSSFDCSGLVGYALELAGLSPTIRYSHNAQMMANECGESEPKPGDLCFYGLGPANIEHVAIYLEGGKALSADGATSHITRLDMAMANPANRVRLHDSWTFRRDLPFSIVLRNSYVTPFFP